MSDIIWMANVLLRIKSHCVVKVEFCVSISSCVCNLKSKIIIISLLAGKHLFVGSAASIFSCTVSLNCIAEIRPNILTSEIIVSCIGCTVVLENFLDTRWCYFLPIIINCEEFVNATIFDILSPLIVVIFESIEHIWSISVAFSLSKVS